MATPDDLTLLPADIAAAATVDANGEVWWPLDQSIRAVDALADAGLVVLGLDLRTYDKDGRFFEWAWSSYQPSGTNDVEQGRQAALAALGRSDVDGNAVLITWQSIG